METVIKKAREVGTSAGVLLPRKWLNKQVVVTLFSPSKEEIAKEIIDILIKKELNEGVRGIYLFGSYAREDYDFGSDIDILVITDKINKLVNYKNYEILLVSEKNFSKNLRNSLYFFSILNEAKVIINNELIAKYYKNKNRFNAKKILKEIKRMVKINKNMVEILEQNNRNIPDGIIYSIILRFRELYLIKICLSNKIYFKKDFLKIIGEKAYSAYIRIKREEKEMDNVLPNEIKNSLDLSEKWLKELKD